MAIWNRMIREGLPQGEHLSKGQEEVREHTMHTSGGGSIPGSGNGKCNDPEAEQCLACLWSRKKAPWPEQSEEESGRT